MQFKLQIGQQLLPILSISSETICFSADAQLTLSLLSETALDANILKKNAMVLLQTDNQETAFFNGIISHIHTGSQTKEGYHTELTLNSPWFLLNAEPHTRVFVKKTVQDVVNSVLKIADFQPTIQWALQHEQQPLASYMQYRETDALFLQRLLAEYGYLFLFDPNQNTLFITDDSSQCANGNVNQLPYAPKKQLQRKGYSILKAQPSGKFLSADIELRNHTRSNSGNIIHINNKTPRNIVAHGCNYQFGVNFVNAPAGKRLQRIRQLALEAERSSLKLTTDCPQIKLGQTLTITNTDLPHLKTTYRVVTIKHQYDANHILPLPTNLHGPKRAIPGYRNYLVLAPKELDYHVPLLQPKRVSILTATIDGITPNQPNIDQQGNYRVRFDDDENQHPPGQASAPITSAQPHTAPNAGVHFPLQPGTKVALYCINGDVNCPVIGGTLADPDNPNVVTDNNPTQHLWQTASGHQVLMDDDPTQSVLRLNTAQQLNQLQLQNSEQPSADLISQQGSMTLNAGQYYVEQAQQTHNVAVGQNHATTINKAFNATTDTGDIQYNAGNNFTQKAAKQLRLNSKNLNSVSQSDANTQVKQSINIEAGDNITLRTQQGDLNINASKGIQIIGDKGILIAQGGGEITLNEQGDLNIQGNSINLIADTIDFASTKLKEGNKGQAAKKPKIQPVAQHWLAAQYLDTNKKPIANLPYTITTADGNKHKGTLDAAGKIKRLNKLTPGNAKITFGDKEKLQQQLAKQRQQLKQTLDLLLIKAKAQAAKDKAQMAHESSFDNALTYNTAARESFAKGAINSLAAMSKGFIELLDKAAKIKQLDGEAIFATASGNKQQLNQVDQQMMQMGHAEYDQISRTLTFIKFLFQDAKTREILLNFAKDYYNSESKLMVDKQIANALGGFMMAIVAAIVTKKATAFAPEVINTATFAKLSPEIDDITHTLKQLNECHEVETAELDRAHVVQKTFFDTYHVVSSAEQGQSILDGINPVFFNPNSRFGKALYITEDPETGVAELKHHGMNITHILRYKINLEQAKVLDLTSSEIARNWEYLSPHSLNNSQKIALMAKKKGYDVIKFRSLRDKGINYAVFKNFQNILSPEMIAPIENSKK